MTDEKKNDVKSEEGAAASSASGEGASSEGTREAVTTEAVQAMAQQEAEAELPAAEVVKADLRPGMTIRVYQKIKEGEKDRIQIFQGMVLAMRGKTPATKTMTVGKRSLGVYVEKIFPLASPLIEKIEVVKTAKVRRAKLYFVKDYAKRLKETLVAQ